MPIQKLKIIPAELTSGGLSELIKELNADLALEYSAAIQYIQHASMLKGNAEHAFAKELLSHADEEMGHAKEIANRINYLGGTVTTEVGERKIAPDTNTMVTQDLEGERVAITRYKARIIQAEALGEIGTAHILRDILVDEEEHENDLETFLKI